MKSIEDFVPEHIKALGGYVPGKPVRVAERESGVRCIKMASNENPFGPSPKAVAAIREAAASVNYYPEQDVNDLRTALATHHDVAPESVLVSDGSTVLIDIIARTLLAPGLNAISSERSFIIYPIATGSAGGRCITIPTLNDGFDLDGILSAITPETRVVYIANPNNPTGTMFSAAETDSFLARVPDHVMVVLDEAYADYGFYFAAQQGLEYSHSEQYVREGRENVIVLRTFSKAHGLAGLRVGYGLGHPQMLAHFARVRTAFSVSAVAEAGALAAMRDKEHIRTSVERNAAGAAYLTKALRDLGLRVVPTNANFLYFEVAEDAAIVSRRMQDAGCIIRALGPWGIRNGLRVTIGSPEQNEKFLFTLRNALSAVVTR